MFDECEAHPPVSVILSCLFAEVRNKLWRHLFSSSPPGRVYPGVSIRLVPRHGNPRLRLDTFCGWWLWAIYSHWNACPSAFDQSIGKFSPALEHSKAKAKNNLQWHLLWCDLCICKRASSNPEYWRVGFNAFLSLKHARSFYTQHMAQYDAPEIEQAEGKCSWRHIRLYFQ